MIYANYKTENKINSMFIVFNDDHLLILNEIIPSPLCYMHI